MAFVINDLRSLVTLAVSMEEVTNPTQTLGPVDGVILDHNVRDTFNAGSIVISNFFFLTRPFSWGICELTNL